MNVKRRVLLGVVVLGLVNGNFVFADDTSTIAETSTGTLVAEVTETSATEEVTADVVTEVTEEVVTPPPFDVLPVVAPSAQVEAPKVATPKAVEKPKVVAPKKEAIKPQKLMTLTSTLKVNVVSEDVLRLTAFLKNKGYFKASPQFTYTKSVETAVKAYQKKSGLSQTGYVDAKTVAKIDADMAKNPIKLPTVQVNVKNAPKGNWAFINKSTNTLYHMNGTKVVEKYNVATGKQANMTPEGKFKIVVKTANPYWSNGNGKSAAGGSSKNPLGPLWLGLSVEGGHTYGIHGNADATSIGKYASSGCVRMFDEEVVTLPKKGLTVNTPVWIGRDSKLKEFGVTFKIS